MKLDNIIYDVESLQAAISQQWSADSEIFASMYPSDTTTSLINSMAAYGSLLQYTLVAALANCYTPTAFSESAIYQLADTLGNDLHGNVSSQVVVSLTKNNFKSINTVIPAYSSFEISGKKFFNPYAVIIPNTVNSVHNITLVQGEIIEVNKTTSGIENEKFYFSSDFKASYNYVTVTVNGAEWTVTDSFLGYDKSYVVDASDMDTVILKTDPDGRSYIKVGDGNLATLPLANSILQIKYCSNDGADGNLAETGLYGNLISPLVFVDNNGNQGELEVEVYTTSTAYGGFSKQSLETLRYTSPYVFASGHRAIRRQDYIALLNNKCGYITSNVWGEYEESNKVGAYDSIMMNMVYYTGLKSFEMYPYFDIDVISDPNYFEGALYSNRGFLGSYSFKISNTKGPSNTVLLQDTGAKGTLFINDNTQDPRDSLLPDWIAALDSSNDYYRVTLNSIVAGGTGYLAGDVLYLTGTNNTIAVRVKAISSTGTVTDVELLSRTCRNLYVGKDKGSANFTTLYGSGVSKLGTGLIVNITQVKYITSNLVTTNDRDYSTATLLHKVENLISNNTDENTYYQSIHEPTLLSPCQIIFNFSNTGARAISGIKFRATDLTKGAYPGTLAMFATNDDNAFLARENLRNSNVWDCIIERTSLDNPYNPTVNDSWSNWFATNCFTGTEDANGKPIYNRYKYYVIEFYSLTDSNDSGLNYVTLSRMKVLYEQDSSEIFYTSNGNVLVNLPAVGSPGPDIDNRNGYLTYSLLGSSNFPMYYYTTTIEGVTTANGYKNGNILAYVFKNENTSVTFVVKVVNTDNGVYSVSINGDTTLAGNELIQLSSPVSLNETLTYTHTLDPINGIPKPGQAGTGYTADDIVEINGSNGQLLARVATVDSSGSVLSLVLTKDFSIGKNFAGSNQTTVVSSKGSGTGHGLVIDLTSVINSGDGTILGKNGTIMIESDKNLKVQASFYGNRIDSADVNYYDEPIIKEFNHFTTYLEFKQPKIKRDFKLAAKVAMETNAVQTSSVVIQNVKNNIQKLFEITPDYIGKSLNLSDVYTAIMSTPNVKWCKVTSPIDNVTAAVNDILVPSDIVIEEVLTRYE